MNFLPGDPWAGGAALQAFPFSTRFPDDELLLPERTPSPPTEIATGVGSAATTAVELAADRIPEWSEVEDALRRRDLGYLQVSVVPAGKEQTASPEASIFLTSSGSLGISGYVRKVPCARLGFARRQVGRSAMWLPKQVGTGDGSEATIVSHMPEANSRAKQDYEQVAVAAERLGQVAARARDLLTQGFVVRCGWSGVHSVHPWRLKEGDYRKAIQVYMAELPPWRQTGLRHQITVRHGKEGVVDMRPAPMPFARKRGQLLLAPLLRHG
jgi:hypothetical protein